MKTIKLIDVPVGRFFQITKQDRARAINARIPEDRDPEVLLRVKDGSGADNAEFGSVASQHPLFRAVDGMGETFSFAYGFNPLCEIKVTLLDVYPWDTKL